MEKRFLFLSDRPLTTGELVLHCPWIQRLNARLFTTDFYLSFVPRRFKRNRWISLLTRVIWIRFPCNWVYLLCCFPKNRIALEFSKFYDFMIYQFHQSRSIINELFKSREEILYFVLESCESHSFTIIFFSFFIQIKNLFSRKTEIRYNESSKLFLYFANPRARSIDIIKIVLQLYYEQVQHRYPIN